MTADNPLPERAVGLMREALALLAATDAHEATGHLRRALDVATRISSPGDKTILVGEGTSCRLKADSPLVRALGGALTLFATILARKERVPLTEVADHLAIYAVVTGEAATDEGMILGCWAGMMRDAAEDEGRAAAD